MIRADLLGNPWAQEWGNIFPLVGPAQQKQPYDVTDLLQAKNVDAIGMVKYGEGFFTSLGFAPLPKTFWERSLFVKPRDRNVVCHASA
jgi:peptidyl-dipeptidase A